jgi:hypothetical protein
MPTRAPARAFPSHAPDQSPARSRARPALQSSRLLGHLRERIRYLHDSLRTEQSYVSWLR